MNTALLGRLPELDDVDDHQAVTHGTLTRCEVDAQLWPCSTVERARALSELDTELLELVDVGWTLFERVPEQLDPRPRGGIVAGYTDDEDEGRVYTVLGWKHGAPAVRRIAARDVNHEAIELPNSRSQIAAYRQLCRHVGKQTGSGDSTEVRYIAMALGLAQSTT
jgi:hypothetical protein